MQSFDDEALATLGLDAFDYVEQVSAALAAHYREDLIVLPKRVQGVPSGAYAMGTQGMWLSRDMALFHNLVGLDMGTYRSAQVVFRSSDAVTLLFIEGNIVSSVLPVTMGIVGAQRFANPSAERLALIGAGVQGRLNLEAFARAFPLKQIDIFSRSRGRAEELAARANDLGLAAQVHDGAEPAVAGADIVVSSISQSLGVEPFLNVAWLKQDAFVSTVDMFRPWRCDGTGAGALLVVDDEQQARDMVKAGRVPNIMPIDTSLGEALAKDRSRPADRPVILLQPGCCASLMGVMAAILDACRRSEAH